MRRRVAVAVLLVAALGVYLAGQRENPPSFYVDESAVAYNAYTLAKHGVDELGNLFPLYPATVGEFNNTVYMNPVYIYALGAVFTVVPPSNLAARRFSAFAGFGAALLMAALAWHLSRSRFITAVIFLTVLCTPMLFETGRLTFEVALYPLVTAIFLWSVLRASGHEPWRWSDVAAIGASLLLLAYTYSIGRLLAILMLVTVAAAFNSRERRKYLRAIVLIIVGLIVVPMAIVNRRTGGALIHRFQELSYTGALLDTPLGLLAALEQHYVSNLLPLEMAFRGDPNPRHHVPGSGGSILLMTFILAVIGAAVALRRRERFWIFVVAATLVSAIPASLTDDQFHTLRMSPFPLFLITLSIPALQTLRPKWLVPILAAGLIQAVCFFYVFHRDGRYRGAYFDAGIAEVAHDALATGKRPIHLDLAKPIHVFWYAAQRGVERSALPVGPTTAHAALVITDRQPPPNAIVVSRHGAFSAYVVP